MRKLLKRLFLFLSLVLLVALAITVAQVVWLKTHNPERTAWMHMRAAQAQAQGKTLVIKRTWLPLPQIPRVMQAAVLAAEDDQFYSHHGFDWDAIQQAREFNEQKERIKRGGSTITQQLAKNLYLSPSRSYVRKAREAVITSLMELLLSKDRILELYLNNIEFGPGVFGVEEGARYHFRVPLRQLSLEQCCLLAAIIPAPLRYKVNGPYVQRRAANIARIVGGSATILR